MDLIVLETNPDGDYKYILTYQDHFSKYMILRPLKNKKSEGVAAELVDIFYLLGAPLILQSDNGREFTAEDLNNELVRLWPGLKIIHGKPRHSQSQGSIERSHRDVESMITVWQNEHNTTRWVESLKYIQWQKNNR